MNSIPKDIAPVYLCPVCGTGYVNKLQAIACRDSTPEPVAKPGDMLLLQLGYGWYDGDPAWVIENGGYKFHNQPTHAFWFVVTSIDSYARPKPLVGDREAHEWRYTVASKALQGLDCGRWTRPRTHHWQSEKDTRRPSESLRVEAQQFVGIKSDTLL